MSEIKKNLQMRDIMGLAITELAAEHEDVILVDADLHTSTRMTPFKERFPDRFIQAGIAEQNQFGIAAGLASVGFTPFPATFACFVARKAIDQFAYSICFPQLNVKVPGSYAGVPTSSSGPSHNSFEDMVFMRAIPNLKVADPGDEADLRAVIKTAYETPGPIYFRGIRSALPDIFKEGHTFKWGKGELLREGSDVTLFGTGMMTDRCIKAADLLLKDGIYAEVVHLASVKPIDEALIIESVQRTGCAVSAENGTVLGGFGSAVAEVLGEHYPVPIKRIGVQDLWIQGGPEDDLMTFYKMQPVDIASAARASMAMKKK